MVPVGSTLKEWSVCKSLTVTPPAVKNKHNITHTSIFFSRSGRFSMKMSIQDDLRGLQLDHTKAHEPGQTHQYHELGL